MCDYCIENDLPRQQEIAMVMKLKGVKKEAKIKDDLIWAATKLVSIRANPKTAPFTTNDLDRLYNILEDKIVHIGNEYTIENFALRL